MTTDTSNAQGEVVAWVAEFPDGWKEFAADGEPEVTEWQTWRQPPSTIRPLAYADIAHLSTPADWRERLEALSSRYEPNSPVGAGIDAAIRELAAAPPPAAARGDVRGLVAKWRDEVDEFYGHPGEARLAAVIKVCADELEAALAAEGVQAGEVEQRARDLLAAELRADMRPGAAEEAESGKLDHDSAMRAIVAALSQQQGQAVALDRMAIRLLVAAGFVTEDKANEALRIAHGFDKGPLASPSAPVVDDAMRKRTREWLASHNGFWDDDYVEGLLTAALSGVSAPVGVEGIEAGLHRVYMDHPDSRLTTTMIHDMAAEVVQSLAQQPAAVDEATIPAWRVMPFTGSWKACDERWEVYSPDGSGGVVLASEVRSRDVADLLDALATQHQEPTT